MATLAMTLAAGVLLAGCDSTGPGTPVDSDPPVVSVQTSDASADGETPSGDAGEHTDRDGPGNGGVDDSTDDGTGDDGTGDDDADAGADADDTGQAATDPTAIPTLDVEVVMDGLTLPWDVQFLADGTALVAERGGRMLAHQEGQARELSLDIPDLFVGSESGLMGMAISPRANGTAGGQGTAGMAGNEGTDGTASGGSTVFLCHATQTGGAPRDIRVTRWLLDDEVTGLEPDGVVVEGLPITSGRHGGCRLLLHDDVLYVGTGDAADHTTPQDTTSLGGKVLALTTEGDPIEGAPHVAGGDPRILTYGHRNVQGLAVHPGTGDLWSAEHGPDTDDEVNVLVPGGNYGWDPGPGYDESVPMTDTDTFADAIEAVWSTGRPTHALSGAAFLQGPAWGAWDGALAIAELRGAGVTVLVVDEAQVLDEARVEELEGTFGRLRSLTVAPDGSLWVTSSNGGGDVVVRMRPID